MIARDNLARPLRQPEPEPRRHLEVAPSRAQRRARPRLVHALVVVGGIGAILLGQLVLSIVLADGAYSIAALQAEQRDLIREEHALRENLELLNSPQNLALNAESLGLVASGNLPYIDLASGAISGQATAAGGSLLAGGNLIGNSLLDGSTVLDPATIAAAQAAGATAGSTEDPGASSVELGGSPVSSTTPVGGGSGTLPSPTTR